MDATDQPMELEPENALPPVDATDEFSARAEVDASAELTGDGSGDALPTFDSVLKQFEAVDEEAGIAPAATADVPGDEQVRTDVICGQCNTKGSWLGTLHIETSETFTRGLGANGLPNCPACGTEMTLVPLLTPENPVAAAARMLDAEKAGNAAKPQYQPSIPGILPPFDFRRAQMTAESLEQDIERCEKEWESAKKHAADLKKEFDEAVERLRTHVTESKNLRQQAEFDAARAARRDEMPAEAAAASAPASSPRSEQCLVPGMWAMDNGAYSGFDVAAFIAMLQAYQGYQGCRFVTAPDVVADAFETLKRWPFWSRVIRAAGFVLALVTQDGMLASEVPWQEIGAIFVGGSTEWKLGPKSRALMAYAKARGLWVYVGRVNSRRRIFDAMDAGADSCDGSGFSWFPDRRIPLGLRWIDESRGRSSQGELTF